MEKIVYGRDSAGLHTATTPQYQGLVARGATQEEAAQKLSELIARREKFARFIGHAGTGMTTEELMHLTRGDEES